MSWLRPWRATAPVPSVEQQTLARFDTATRTELAALPRSLRNAIIADRKRRVTAALQRTVASGRIAPLRSPEAPK